MKKYQSLHIEPDRDADTVFIPRDNLVSVCDTASGVIVDGIARIAVRESGDLANKAIFLDKTYDWTIGTDALGALCLVPLRKR